MYPLSIATCFDKKNMPTEKEILNMLDVGWKPFQSIPSPFLALNRKGKVFPLCDASFRSPNYAHRQAFIALWVHHLKGCTHCAIKGSFNLYQRKGNRKPMFHQAFSGRVGASDAIYFALGTLRIFFFTNKDIIFLKDICILIIQNPKCSSF